MKLKSEFNASIVKHLATFHDFGKLPLADKPVVAANSVPFEDVIFST